MTRRITSLLALLLLFRGSARADAPPVRKPVQVVQDRAALARKLHSLGRSNHGGIDPAKVEAEGNGNSGLPTFSSSFRYGGTQYPFTMVGYPLSSGQTATIRPVLIPLRLDFVYFGAQGDVNVTLDPRRAVNNILRSPIFNDATFANGTGQFGDMLQRATFWNKMDSRHSWHVRFSTPRVLPTIDVEVDPTIGDLYNVGGSYYGDIYIGALDSTLHTILQLVNVEPDELPIFVTYNSSADVALGYHDAFVLGRSDGSDALQTLVYSSWLEPFLFGDLLADVSTLNHEVGEWLNDPYVNNIVPLWNFPNIATCGENPFLEVGDPQGNGPNYADFPVVPVKLNGYVYHLQDLVMLPWFAGESPSSAQNGWYDFPATNEIHAPFVPCGP